MCTSIVSNRKKTIIGWNLDILNMEYQVIADDDKVYIAIRDEKEGWMPLFGANARGDFVAMPTCWPFDDRSNPENSDSRNIIMLDIDLLLGKKTLSELEKTEPFSYNAGSCRALEKAGFRYEGTLKNNAVKNGKVQDMKMYAITREVSSCIIRRLDPEKLPEALSLVWEVFCKYEAPEYSEEGITEFRNTIEALHKIRSMNFYGAFYGDTLVGVLAKRKPQHISLFFVKEEYHRTGIGRQLFEAMRKDYEIQEFTVNSSPYAVEIYKHLGFCRLTRSR